MSAKVFDSAAFDRTMFAKTYTEAQLVAFVFSWLKDREVEFLYWTAIHEAAAYLVAHQDAWTNFRGVRLQAHGRTAEELVAQYRYEMDVRRAGNGT